jgi:hypothetical protein
MHRPPHVLARVLPEHARTEQDRSCHIFPLPEPGEFPELLRAYCGFVITPGQAERLSAPTGMPCMPCMLMTVLPEPA